MTAEKEIALKIYLPEDIHTEITILGMRKKPHKLKANEVIQDIIIGHIAKLQSNPKAN